MTWSLGTWILASETTVKETQGKLVSRRFDRIRVVGIKEPVRVYEILEMKENASEEIQEQAYLFNKAMDHFENRNWNDAAGGFNNVLKIFPDDPPSLLYLTRCHHFQKNEPEKNWDGVFDIKEK